MDVKRVTKTDVTIKTARIENDVLVDENGEEISVIDVAKKLYGDGEFKLTMTRSTSEEVDIDDVDEE